MKSSLSTVGNIIKMIESICNISLVDIVIKDKGIYSAIKYNGFFNTIPSIILDAPIDKYELISDEECTKLRLYVKCRHLMNINFDIAESLPTRAYLIDELMNNPKNGIFLTDKILDMLMESTTMLSILYNRFHQSVSEGFFFSYMVHTFSTRPKNIDMLYKMWIRTGLINCSVSEVDMVDTRARVLFAEHSIDDIDCRNYIVNIIQYILDNLGSGHMMEESLDLLNVIVTNLSKFDENDTELVRMVSCLLMIFYIDKTDQISNSKDIDTIRKGLRATQNGLNLINNLINRIEIAYNNYSKQV